MAYVVTQGCIGHKHTVCVDVCPVDAFREGPDRLVIDPESCIECNACLTECPERAIFPQNAVPADQQPWIALNAEQALIYPPITESRHQDNANSPLAAYRGRFAVIGSGPSGFYAADALLKQLPEARVDLFERLPTPFGLVRYGVAPDHPRIKTAADGFERIAKHPRFRFFGHVDAGRDITRDELLQHYTGVIYATGGSRSRPLPLPGADLPNIFGSSVFVGWYNGHPDQRDLQVDLSHAEAVVIGIGNVALDIARMLILPHEQLRKTDTADHALCQFRQSNVKTVHLLARRGPAEAAFTPKELEQLIDLPNLNLVVNEADLELDADTLQWLEQPENSEARQNIELLRQLALRPQQHGAHNIVFHFGHSPLHIEAGNGNSKILTAAGNVSARDDRGKRVWQPSEDRFQFEAGLIVHAIGYQGDAIDGVPFDERRGVVLNHKGRISDTNSNAIEYALPREYSAGWIKRGASGVIGSNKHCAQDTVRQLIEDLNGFDQRDRFQAEHLVADITDLLQKKHVEFIHFDDWLLLDGYEQEQGRQQGRPRVKITDSATMLDIIREERRRKQKADEWQASQPVKTNFRTCTLCEAMCGVVIETQGNAILSIAGDPDDHHSKGHICPKGYSLQDLHNDPDRLKTPLQKVNGEWQPIGWDEALDIVAQRFSELQAHHGNDAVAAYWGNPSSHNLGILMSAGKLRKAIGSRNIFTAASLDQMPHQLMSYLMFGHGQVFTIPDIDHTDYLLMLGANPAASNGSLMSSGDVLKRMEDIEHRGGKMVLVDPRRNESARYVSQHVFIKPGTDPYFLYGIIQHLIQNNLYQPDRLLPIANGWDELLNQFERFSIEHISELCQVPVATIQQVAEEFAAAKRAICYGRMGISTQPFAALNHWLINVLNIITGNLDRRGGMMFTQPAVDMSIKPHTAGSFNQYQTRVRGLPEFNREFPTAALAEEILVPGKGQVKAFICIAGNPVLSAPNGRQLDKALEQLDFMVSVDFYLNETSRHADIILPPTGPLEHEQYDLVFNLLSVRNTAKFAEPLFEPDENSRSDWDIMLGIIERLQRIKQGDAYQPKPEMSPHQIVDFGLRSGPYGETYTAYENGEPVEQERGLSLKELKKYPHGLDLGPMRPCLPEYLFTADKKIQLLPEPVMEDLKRLQQQYADAVQQKNETNELMLIGRRDLRTNNSWMHNSERLVKGKDRCALFIHPQDAAQRNLDDRSKARIQSRVGELLVDVKVTEDILPGVVSLPHGWGHQREGVRLRVAQSNPGLSVNDLTDDQLVDGFSGNAVFNAVPVLVTAQ